MKYEVALNEKINSRDNAVEVKKVVPLDYFMYEKFGNYFQFVLNGILKS